MTSTERRKVPSQALTVNNAIWLSQTEGTTPAMDFLQEKGVPDDVVLRVLGGPEFRRQLRDRRRSKRR